jgi:hypothetical protein
VRWGWRRASNPSFLDLPAEDRLIKLEAGAAYRWEEGTWVESEWAYRRVSGISGDSDFEEITEAEARAYQAWGG